MKIGRIAAGLLALAAAAFAAAGVPAFARESSAAAIEASARQPVAGSARRARTYRVIGVGDIMMGSDWPEPIMDPRVTPGGDPQAVIGAELARLFASGDVVFGNFEGTIHTSSQGAKACSNPRVCFTFRSPPFHADYLRRVGFTLVSNANNHSRDFGEGGRAETYRHLTRAGMAVAGADTPSTRLAVQTLRDGRRFALVAFGHNPGLLQVTDYGRLAQMVRDASTQADVVVVSCHIGGEGASFDRVTRATEIFLNENRGDPFRFARTAVDAGADIVFCHGPHVPRAIEVYRGRFIAYSLGNFWTYGRFNLSGNSGLAPVAALEVNGAGELVAARIVSARQDRPGGPYLDPAAAAARRIAELSARDLPEAGIRIEADGTVRWRR